MLTKVSAYIDRQARSRPEDKREQMPRSDWQVMRADHHELMPHQTTSCHDSSIKVFS